MSLPTKPGNAERGWNDPPMILHSSEGPPPSGPAQKRTALNKRVAYPADSTIASTPVSYSAGEGPPPMIPVVNSTPTANQELPTQSTDVLSTELPPAGVVLFPPSNSTEIPKFTAPIIVPTMNPGEGSQNNTNSVTATNPITNTQVSLVDNSEDELGIPNFDDDTQMFHYTMSKLQKTLLDVQDRLQPKVVDVIKKKLEIFSSMWESGSISYEVKSSMARLATALHKRRCDLADSMHMALMMDFVSEVGQWMVGIKRLIQEARGTDAPLSPTDSTISHPVHPTSETAATSEPKKHEQEQSIDNSSNADNNKTDITTTSCDTTMSGTTDSNETEDVTRT